MPDYNPNARWTSKKNKVEYVPSESSRGPLIGGRQLVSMPRSSDGRGRTIGITIAIIVAVTSLAFGIWYFATRPAPAPVVGLGSAPDQVTAGSPFTYSVLYVNSSTVALRNATLEIALPTGVFFVGQPQSQETETIPLGDIMAGDSGKQDFPLLVTAGTGSVVQVSSTLSYATDASHGAFFSTSNEGSVAVNNSPGAVGLSISTPQNVFSGQDFMTTVSYRNATGQSIDGVKITMQYPQGFTFAQANPSPAFPGDTSWNIGSLAPGEGGEILITGSITGQDTALYAISASAVESVSGESYAAAAEATNVAITVAPLTIGAVVNYDPNYIAKTNDNLDYNITYANMSSTTFQNVAITATLSGAMFDLTSVQSDAAFNSKTDTLTWYPANTPELASVAPGGSGSVDLRIKTKTSFPIASAADKDFTLGLHLTVSSLTVPVGTVASSTSASADVTSKVGGVAAIDAVGYRYEPGSGTLNFGPYPPKVNQSTAYTIHWRVADFSTDISGVTVSAYLQSGATCTGKVTSTIGTQPVCDPETGEVTWTIPSLTAGTGVLSAPAEAVFQIENMPAVNQVGETVELLGPTSLTATDEFTGATLSASSYAITTYLPADSAAAGSDGRVTQ